MINPRKIIKIQKNHKILINKSKINNQIMYFFIKFIFLLNFINYLDIIKIIKLER